MSDGRQGLTTCRIVCILLGILAGALAWYLLEGNVGALAQVILTLLVFVAVSFGLYLAFCGEESSQAVDAGSAAAGAAAATTVAVATSASASDTTPVSNLTSSTKSKTTKPKTAAKTASKGASKSASAGKAKAKTAKASASKATASKKKAPAKKAGPQRLTKPKGGKADDLKMIAGVGPKLEKTLNGLGFWHFDQIAKWKKADVAIVDDELSFKGRIERDDWIKQAKALAKGGEAEYIKVFGKKPR